MDLATATFTSLDILYLVLSVVALLVGIFLVVFLINVTSVVRDLRKITRTAGDITENIHGLVLTPVQYLSKITHTITPFIENFVSNRFSNFMANWKAQKASKEEDNEEDSNNASEEER